MIDDNKKKIEQFEDNQQQKQREVKGDQRDWPRVKRCQQEMQLIKSNLIELIGS